MRKNPSLRHKRTFIGWATVKIRSACIPKQRDKPDVSPGDLGPIQRDIKLRIGVAVEQSNRSIGEKSFIWLNWCFYLHVQQACLKDLA
jgi:hypothetical protein